MLSDVAGLSCILTSLGNNLGLHWLGPEALLFLVRSSWFG